MKIDSSFGTLKFISGTRRWIRFTRYRSVYRSAQITIDTSLELLIVWWDERNFHIVRWSTTGGHFDACFRPV